MCKRLRLQDGPDIATIAPALGSPDLVKVADKATRNFTKADILAGECTVLARSHSLVSYPRVPDLALYGWSQRG